MIRLVKFIIIAEKDDNKIEKTFNGAFIAHLYGAYLCSKGYAVNIISHGVM